MILSQGVCNGLTMDNITEYPVEMRNEEMLEAILARLADFIINPGLSQDAVSKEIYAVSAEYRLRTTDSTICACHPARFPRPTCRCRPGALRVRLLAGAGQLSLFHSFTPALPPVCALSLVSALPPQPTRRCTTC